LKNISSQLQRTGQEYHSRTDLAQGEVSIELDWCGRLRLSRRPI